MQHFWTGVYILMAAGALVMLQSFFGICGAFQRKTHMLVAVREGGGGGGGSGRGRGGGGGRRKNGLVTWVCICKFCV